MLQNYNDILTTEEIADILRLNERTIIKLVKENKLPAIKIANQYRYSKAKIIEWIESGMDNSQNMESNIDNSELNYQILINHYIKPAHINTDLKSTDRESVLKELVQTASDTGLIPDRDSLLSSVIQRENNMSTAIGSNFALPHPRICTDQMVKKGLIVIGISKKGIIFDNKSGKLIQIFLLFAIPDLTLHLHMMSYFVKILKNEETKKKFLNGKDSQEFINFLANPEFSV